MRFIPEGAYECLAKGYKPTPEVSCPPYSLIDECPENDYYVKCNQERWCKENGYTISSCSSPKYLDAQCPNNLALYKYCTCPSSYQYSCSSESNVSGGSGTVCNGKYTACTCNSPFIWSSGSCVCPDTYVYACSGTGYSSGSGVGCNGKYTACTCATNYTWSGSVCVCDSSFKYTCSGTGYSSGSGTACGGKYKSCNCSAYYTWDGSACTHTHSYVCPSGSYSSSSSCTYGTSGTVSKACACGATSGTCYKCTTCTSSSSNYCWVHDTCHGDCCSDGTYEPCEEICGGSGCCSSSSSNYCSYHGECHGDCCTDGTYESCDTRCGGSGCDSSSSSSSSGGSTYDPCDWVGCPTEVTCEYGCASYTTASDCCESVCESCNPCDWDQYYSNGTCYCRLYALNLCCEYSDNGCCIAEYGTNNGYVDDSVCIRKEWAM
ncbi:MAG: hypothetical protein IJX20_01170 [Alphaproteobacteria bacterium]|nr:hypothetical protein [Alphaproteobacteria bacterium]